jgi:hypothetical protein
MYIFAFIFLVPSSQIHSPHEQVVKVGQVRHTCALHTIKSARNTRGADFLSEGTIYCVICSLFHAIQLPDPFRSVYYLRYDSILLYTRNTSTPKILIL